MFLKFFYLLRERGLKVSLNEWMMLIEALDKGLCGRLSEAKLDITHEKNKSLGVFLLIIPKNINLYLALPCSAQKKWPISALLKRLDQRPASPFHLIKNNGLTSCNNANNAKYCSTNCNFNQQTSRQKMSG